MWHSTIKCPKPLIFFRQSLDGPSIKLGYFPQFSTAPYKQSIDGGRSQKIENLIINSASQLIWETNSIWTAEKLLLNLRLSCSIYCIDLFLLEPSPISVWRMSSTNEYISVLSVFSINIFPSLKSSHHHWFLSKMICDYELWQIFAEAKPFFFLLKRSKTNLYL